MGERQRQEAQVIPLRGRQTNGRPVPRPLPSNTGSTRPVEPTPIRPVGQPTTGIKQAIAETLGFVRKRLTGDYQIDEFGFDRQLTDTVILPPLKAVYDKWFRVEALGTENIPATGGALIVANHSGTLPIDSVMMGVAVHSNTKDNRHLRMLGADLVFQTPILGALARKTGQTLACMDDAERLLCSGELVGVWPEGFKGIGKPFKDRYKLQRFGRGGFVAAALRTGVPIIPASVVGAEEIYPKIGDLKPLARLLGLPYFPITPTFPLLGPLGAIPLPTKWYIEFGTPIRTDEHTPADADDPAMVFNLTDQVRETIQQTIYRLLDHRQGIFRG